MWISIVENDYRKYIENAKKMIQIESEIVDLVIISESQSLHLKDSIVKFFI
jgi:hypothetical protein